VRTNVCSEKWHSIYNPREINRYQGYSFKKCDGLRMNIYVPSNWWRRETFRRVSNRWWMRTLSQSSLHRKWSGSLFTNADKTTSLHLVVFYLYFSRKRRINLDTLFSFLLRSLTLPAFPSVLSVLSLDRSTENPSSHFRSRYASLRLSYLFLPLKPLCTLLSLFSAKFHGFGNTTSCSRYLPPTARRM